MSAAALLREAAQVGVTLRLAEGKPKVSGSPSPELLGRLRAAKPELIEILDGTRCRLCGVTVSRPSHGLVTCDDGTVEHGWCRRQEMAPA